MERRIRRRVLWAVAVVATVVVAIGVGGYLWLTSDGATPVALDDVVAEFRAGSTAATSASTSTSTVAPSTSGRSSSTASSAAGTTAQATTTTTEPAALGAGVYLYATTGDERVDALGGSEHVYPTTTTITVTNAAGGCVTTRWAALEERWEDEQYCPQADGWALSSKSTFHSFFHQSDERDFTCTTGSMQLPGAPRVDETFTATCNSAGTSESGASSEDISAQVIGFEQLDVGGEPVDTVHIRYETTIGGESVGSDTTDRWYAVDVPLLLVRETRTGGTTSETAIGDVRYEEQYDMELQSLEPIS